MRSLVLVASGFGLIVLIMSWVVHCKIQPYQFPFQNKLESWLFGCAITTLIIASLYTFANAESPIIENLMVLVVLGSVIGCFLQVSPTRPLPHSP